MRRGYTTDDYRCLVERIRATVPRVSLSTDLIVGFPGESEAAFERTLEMVEEVRFGKVHAAAYSTRPGTIASRKMEDDIPAEEKKRRLQAIESLQERVAAEINAGLLGTTQEVLIEGREKGKWRGRNRNDKLVFLEDYRGLQGSTVKACIQKTSPWSLQGVAAN